MGNRVSSIHQPTVMTDAFLEEEIVNHVAQDEDLDVSELHRLVKIDGLHPSFVLSLNFENYSLINIADLWKFTYLKKLEMPNNLIENIEGLAALSHLEYLDLSFNYIKFISGLEGLSNLKHLNLSSNEIWLLENMEHLKKLEMFVIRHNKMTSFNNIRYITQFDNLYSLGISGNPLSQNAEIRLQILVLLPQLRYLDFSMVTEKELREAFEKYPLKLKANDVDLFMLKETEKTFPSLCNKQISNKEAFIDGLGNGRGLETLLACDKNFQLLHSFPLASSVTKYHCSYINTAFDEWHQHGYEFYEKMQQEKLELIKMVKEVHEYVLNIAREDESRFITLREQIPCKLCLIYQKFHSSEEKDRKVEELKEEYKIKLLNTHRNFMLSLCLCADLILNMCKIFSHEMDLLKDKYMEAVRICYQKIVDADKLYAAKLSEFYSEIIDTGLNVDAEIKNDEGEPVELDPILQRLLKGKDLIDTVLHLGVSIHTSVLHLRIERLKESLQNYKDKALEDILENEVISKQENHLAAQ
ncbi:dynein regulatory complex subunit 3-like isoform X2 [Stegodyphus dumicola]|uniref:dynein regulatory complex subunit 3-like isoform X2 n=1 Tax=Stegodyphus dumicola TaxID=202533 RepID=UPI0015ADDF11|nr:dynein regulatory complex subunit 3-like isoform X2 [Stegodyphus dumicola]